MNADLMRRLSFLSMIIAIVAGIISLWQLFAAAAPNFAPAAISVIALVIGLGFDRRARQLEDSNAG